MRRMPRRPWMIGCPALLAVLALAACGGSATPAPTGPAGATGAPPSGEPPPFARTINGEVTYAGSRLGSHRIVIAAQRDGGQGEPAYSATLTRPGKYSLTGVADGTYTVVAFIDIGDDMGAALPDEPQGVFGSGGQPSQVVVKDGNAPIGINIAIQDR